MCTACLGWTDLASPLAERTFYAVRIFLEGGVRLLGGFERFRLAGGKVSYEDGYMSAQEFQKRSACASPSPGK